MSRQEEILTNLRKSNFLLFRNGEPSEFQLTVNELTSLPVGEFKRCCPITEPTWIPLEFLRYAVYATKTKQSLIFWNIPKVISRRYSSLLYYLSNYFLDYWQEELFKAKTAKGTYYLTHGCIANDKMQPLLQVMVKVAPRELPEPLGEDGYYDSRVLDILDSKVLIDYSVYGAAGEAEKLIKNQIIPAFIENQYLIELCNLKDTVVWDRPIVPRRLEKSRDLCYDVLKENFKTFDKMLKR